MANTQTTPAGQVICRSCGFDAHPVEDLIDGQCPRWAPSDGIFRDHAANVTAVPFGSDFSYGDAS